MTIDELTDDDLALIARQLDEPSLDTHMAAIATSHMRSLVKEAQQHRAQVAAEQAVPRCSAHGEMACELCALNPGSCATEAWQCEMWRNTGMHWDTCPNRIRGYAGALTYFAKKLADQDKHQRAELSHFRLAAVKAQREREEQS